MLLVEVVMVVMRDQYGVEIPKLVEAYGHCSRVYQDAGVAGLDQQAGMAKMRDLHAGLSPSRIVWPIGGVRSTVPRIAL